MSATLSARTPRFLRVAPIRACFAPVPNSPRVFLFAPACHTLSHMARVFCVLRPFVRLFCTRAKFATLKSQSTQSRHALNSPARHAFLRVASIRALFLRLLVHWPATHFFCSSIYVLLHFQSHAPHFFIRAIRSPVFMPFALQNALACATFSATHTTRFFVRSAFFLQVKICVDFER